MRERVMRVAVLNVTMHPHTTEGYIDLFKKAKGARVIAAARGERSAMITQFSQTRTDPNIYTGLLSSFVELNPNAPWLNLTRGDAAVPEELEQIQVPEELKPGMKQALFAFAADSHRFIFEDGVLGASVHDVRKTLYHILNDPRVRPHDIAVNVIVEQEQSTLDRIFGMHKLTSLEIMVLRPNPDDFGDADEEIEKRLGSQKARKMVVRYDAERRAGLVPDEQTRKLAGVAISNGQVVANGKPNQTGPKERISTADYPVIVSDPYDPAETTKDVALLKAARVFMDRLKKR